MNECDYIESRRSFYLDDELRADERVVFEEHLDRCQSCRDEVTEERQFLEGLRQAGPLYEAPVELRRRIEEIASRGGLRDVTPVGTESPSHSLRSQSWLLGSGFARSWFARLGRIERVASLSAIGILVALLGIYYLRGAEPPLTGVPSGFAKLAVEAHQQHLGGELRLEISSTSPEVVSDWFSGQVSFSVKLPNYQEASGQNQLYQIEGGRVVRFNNDPAAYVSYQMDKQPISLLVTTDSVAAPSGGEEVVSKGITFHYDTIDGFKVITWSDRGLTYALVSNLKERGQQSCLVCHQGTRDKDFLEGFNAGASAPGQSYRIWSSATTVRPLRRFGWVRIRLPNGASD
ncbi:MAG TPA: zf-HC2 domain-containing protein [Blastocatellia bacterium]|nr:zf-HC2 domain-containing protein [Blastocatellia bacterium]